MKRLALFVCAALGIVIAQSCMPYGSSGFFTAPIATPSAPSFSVGIKLVYVQFKNKTKRTVFPSVDDPGECIATDQPPRPITPSGYSRVIAVGATGACDEGATYGVLWGHRNPPGSGCSLIVTTGDPFTGSVYQFSTDGSSLKCKLTKYTTHGGVLIHLVTISPR